MQKQWGRIAAGLLLFGISFAYVEAAVVVYLRNLSEPVLRTVNPKRAPDDLFPLITPQQLRAASPERARLVGVEVVREAATLLMICGVALVAGGKLKIWVPAFAVAFGVWDLFYYVFLKVLADWPASLFTWDVLFLIPVPWAAPVLAPGIVSVTMITAGLVALRSPVQMRRSHWSATALGCCLILASFMWDFQNIVAGGLPHPFAWSIFGVGEVLGVGAFVHAAKTRSPPIECE